MNEEVSISFLAYASEERRESNRRHSAIALLVAFHPLLLLVALYTTWLIAFATLGRAPRPSMDDPAQIGGAVQFVLPVAAVVIFHWPILAVIAIATLLWLPLKPHALTRVFITMVGLYVLTWWLIDVDPGNIACWFFD